jgi:HK97 family phage prohead protease
MNVTERRFIQNEFEIRSEANGFIVAGHAAVFDSRSQNLGGFVEDVAHGAFAKTIQEADVRALWNHDANFPLGRNRAGTLRLAEDESGLYYEVDMPDTTYARDLVVSMQRGDVTQSSFGFRVIKDDWGLTEDDFPVRTLKEVALSDVSPVTYPAYLDADSGVASRALRRFADSHDLPFEAVAADLVAAIRGDDITKPDEAKVSSTFVALRRDTLERPN